MRTSTRPTATKASPHPKGRRRRVPASPAVHGPNGSGVAGPASASASATKAAADAPPRSGSADDERRSLSVQCLVSSLLAVHLCSAAARARFLSSPSPACRDAAAQYTAADCLLAAEVLEEAARPDRPEAHGDLMLATDAFRAFLHASGFPLPAA